MMESNVSLQPMNECNDFKAKEIFLQFGVDKTILWVIL
jgi:hypothetical protein